MGFNSGFKGLKLLVPDSCLPLLLLKPLMNIPSVLHLFLSIVIHALVFSVRILYFAYLTVHMLCKRVTILVLSKDVMFWQLGLQMIRSW